MGIIRLFLALSVVFSHTYGHLFIAGINAVQCFYVISGFLIAGILPKQNDCRSVFKFYVSRYLRLYPTYIFVAFLTIIFYTFTNEKNILTTFSNLPIFASFLIALSNLIIIGQDVLFFLYIKMSEISFTTDFNSNNLHRFLLIPQSWTLAIELSFYLFAPFVLKKRFIYIFLFCSVGARIFLLFMGVGSLEPWAYRFFPAELTFFIIGAISRQKLLPTYEKIFRLNFKKYSEISIVIFLLYLASFSIIPGDRISKSIFLILILALIMPFLYNFSKCYKFDRIIGELSYPIYVSHVLIYLVIIKISHIANITGQFKIAMYTILLTIAFSILILNLIEYPMKKLRHKIY